MSQYKPRFALAWAVFATDASARLVGVLMLYTVFFAASCDRERASSDAPGVNKPEPAESLEQLSHRLGARLSQIQARFEQPFPEPTTKASCSKLNGSKDQSAPLGVRVRDVRDQAKELFPLAITRMLTTHEFDPVKGVFRAAEFSDHGPTLKSRHLAERALGLLAKLDRARYVAVISVRDYSSPKLVLKRGKRKREWLPGRLFARLGVHELASGTALCAHDIVLSNQVSEMPIRLRLREATRERLTRQLGEKLRTAVLDGLGSRFGEPPNWP